MSETLRLAPGVYRHYKGNDYQVLHVARHSETEELLVVYRPLYGDSGIWVGRLKCLLNMFRSKARRYLDSAG